MLARPLPVEVTSTWWDYVVDVADVLAGLGAAGALLIAALAYRQQVQDKRRQLASRVTIRVGDGQVGKQVEVVNDGEMAIYKALWVVESPEDPMVISKHSDSGRFTEIRALETAIQFVHELPEDRGFRGSVKFCDSSGKAWERSMDGSLAELKDPSYWPKSSKGWR